MVITILTNRDAFVKYAQENELTIIGHTLVWKNSAPVKNLKSNIK